MSTRVKNREEDLNKDFYQHHEPSFGYSRVRSRVCSYLGKALTLRRIDFSSSGAHVLIDIDIARYHGQPFRHLASTNRCTPADKLGQLAARWRSCSERTLGDFPKFIGFSRKNHTIAGNTNNSPHRRSALPICPASL